MPKYPCCTVSDDSFDSPSSPSAPADDWAPSASPASGSGWLGSRRRGRGAHSAGRNGPRSGSRGGARNGAGRPRRRGRRILIVGFSSVIVLALLLGVTAAIYARYRYDQIPKVTIHSLTPESQPTNKQPSPPFDVLLVGSDSRSFVQTSQQQSQFGNNVTGQRSDVIIIARVAPALHQVMMLSIPRDTWINIPGKVPYISGMNRINAAFNSGPDLLVQTIQKDFGIPINHYLAVNFAGFAGIVDALGGIYLDFKMPVKDKNSGLNITQAGCQKLSGPQALSLVRSRDEYYSPSPGVWDYDGMGDWSRIRRQDAFFHAVLAKVDGSFTDPIEMNNFIGAAVKDVTIDSALSESALLSMANDFRGLGQKALNTEVLPTEPEVLNGADVLLPAQPYDQQMIAKFLAFGTKPATSSSTTTTVPAIPPSQISVQVLNGNGLSGAAGTAATALQGAGFKIAGTGDAASFTYSANEIEYPSSERAEAQVLAAHLVGGAHLVADASLQGKTIDLIVGSTYNGVTGPSQSQPATTTTSPSGNVVFDTPQTLPEPWDPTTCNP